MQYSQLRLVLVMVSLKWLAYEGGGNVAIKKLIMNGTYLTLAVFAGNIFYNEPLTIGKFLGIFGFIVAFILIDERAWKAILISVRLLPKKA